MSAPEKNTDFDEAYRSDVGHMMWTDSNVPTELKNFIRQNSPLNALELGCGLGLFADYFSKAYWIIFLIHMLLFWLGEEIGYFSQKGLF